MRDFDTLVTEITKIYPHESFFVRTTIRGRQHTGEVVAKNSKQAKAKFISRILRRLGVQDKHMGIEISKALPYTYIKANSAVSTNIPITHKQSTLLQSELNL